MPKNKFGVEFFTFEALFYKTLKVIDSFQLPKGSKVLDVPAGAGALAQILKKEYNFEVSAAEFITSNWACPEVEVQFADLSKSLPYEDQSFDLTICLEGLKHVYNLHTAIQELARVTKPNGYILVSIPNDLNIQTKFNYLWDSFVDTDWRGPIDPEDEMIKKRWYVGSLIQFPYLYNLLRMYGVEFSYAIPSRKRGLSLFLMYLLYPVIYWKTTKLCKKDPVLKRELLSSTWLSGRHCLMVCKKS